MKKIKILFTSSTLPASDSDPVPAFVRDEAIWFKKIYPKLDISILVPHSAYSKTQKFTKHKYYDEHRFHYFWPYTWEKLTGKGIQPALKKNRLLYLQLPSLFIAEFFATWIFIKKNKPDIVYAHWFTPQALTASLACKLTRTPLVFDTQASDAIVLKNVPFAKKIVIAICRQAIAYTVPSQMTLDKLLYFTNKKNRQEILGKATMVPYGTTRMKTDQKTIKKSIELYNLEKKRVIYFIGRLVDRKGVDILIKAFSKLNNNDDKLRLVIAGDGQSRDKFEELAKQYNLGNSVIFTGFLTGNIRFGLLEAADLCVVPSINVGDQAEGLPVVFMEAISAGKIVVLSDATGAHEIVNHGKNAFISKAGSVDDLVDKMEQALRVKNSGNKNFYKNVNMLSEKFQWPNIAKRRYEALKIDTLGKK